MILSALSDWFSWFMTRQDGSTESFQKLLKDAQGNIGSEITEDVLWEFLYNNMGLDIEGDVVFDVKHG